MPAQTRDGQIGVPVFRMLGSDPINQYDSGMGEPAQGVETLEPVYESGGGNPRWIDWFFGMMTEGECLAYQYVQAGQENSFTWLRMQRGLEYQVRVIDSLSRAGQADRTNAGRDGPVVQGAFRNDAADQRGRSQRLQGSRTRQRLVRLS